MTERDDTNATGEHQPGPPARAEADEPAADSPRRRVQRHLRRLLKYGLGAGAAVQISYACIDPPGDDDDGTPPPSWCAPFPEGAADREELIPARAERSENSSLIRVSFLRDDWEWRPVQILDVEGGVVASAGLTADGLNVWIDPDPLAASLIITIEARCDGAEVESSSVRYRLADPNNLPEDDYRWLDVIGD
jgi:hypothetical protein